MHFRKALIVKMSNLRPLHHKQTIDLFKREGFENKQNDALQNGEPFQKKVFTCFAKEQLHFIAKLPLTLQINSKVFMILKHVYLFHHLHLKSISALD